MVEVFGAAGDVDGVFDEAGELVVALGGDGEEPAGASGDFLNIVEAFRTCERWRGHRGPLWRCRRRGSPCLSRVRIHHSSRLTFKLSGELLGPTQELLKTTNAENHRTSIGFCASLSLSKRGREK